MNISQLLASTLSLVLVACSAAPLSQGQAPVKASAIAPQTQAGQRSTDQHSTDKEKLKVQLRFPTKAAFQTQNADAGRLAFVQLSVAGQGLSVPVTHDGAAFLPVSGNSVSATISNVRISNGAIRVVTVRGFDANQNLLPGFEAKAVYVSQTGTLVINLNLSRRTLLLGRVVESLLGTNPSLAASLDRPTLQTVLDEAMGYDPIRENFVNQPENYDLADLIAAIPASGPLPIASALNTAALGTSTPLVVKITTPSSAILTEDLTLAVNDPDSRPISLPRGTASNSNHTLSGVGPGNWTIEARNAAGTVVGSTGVSISPSGSISPGLPTLALTNAETLIGEFLVNTRLTNSQFAPYAAFSSNGNFVVSWTSYSQDTSDDGIFVQAYDAAGKRRGGERQANTYFTGFQTGSDLAINDAGNFVVVWSSPGQDGDGSGVYGQRFDSSGNYVGAEFQIHTQTAGHQFDPKVEMDSDGDFIVTFVGPDQSGYGIYTRRFEADATPKDAQQVQSNNLLTGGVQNTPNLTVDSDGNYLVTWNQGDGAYIDVHARRYDASGTALGDEFRVNTNTQFTQDNAVAAFNDDGSFVISWTSFVSALNPIANFARCYDSAGQPLGDEFRVTAATTGFQSALHAANDGGGYFTLYWYDGGNSYAQHFNGACEREGNEFLFTSGGFVMGPSGSYLKIEHKDDGGIIGDGGIFARRYDDLGRAE